MWTLEKYIGPPGLILITWYIRYERLSFWNVHIGFIFYLLTQHSTGDEWKSYVVTVTTTTTITPISQAFIFVLIYVLINSTKAFSYSTFSAHQVTFLPTRPFWFTQRLVCLLYTFPLCNTPCARFLRLGGAASRAASAAVDGLNWAFWAGVIVRHFCEIRLLFSLKSSLAFTSGFLTQ